MKPIIHEGVIYSVPNDRGTVGYIVATEEGTGRVLWKKTIYRVWICPLVEHDVQWVFIKAMWLEEGNLIVVNERGKTYGLTLKTRKVRKLRSGGAPGPGRAGPVGSGT